MTATYDCIATTTAAGSETNISFTSISGSFTDLVLVCQTKRNNGGGLIIKSINGDTGNNYSDTYLAGTGVAVETGRDSNTNKIYADYQSTNNLGMTIVHFMNYSNSTTYKTLITRGSDAGVYVLSYVGLWRNTNAITSFTVSTDSAATFASGSTFTLYGIKAE